MSHPLRHVIGLALCAALWIIAASAHAQELRSPGADERSARPDAAVVSSETDSGADSRATVEERRAAQDPDGRIFLWPTAFRLEHQENRVDASWLGASYTRGVGDVANVSVGMSFVGALSASAKVGFDTERLSLAAHGGGGVLARGGDSLGFGYGGGIATVGGRKIFANVAYSAVVASQGDGADVYHLASVGLSARVHPRLRLIGHGALGAMDFPEEETVDISAWWMLGFQVWGTRLSGTLGAGTFGDHFYRAEADTDCVDCGRSLVPAVLAQIAHVW